MIKNQLQYKVSAGQLKKFEAALVALESVQDPPADVHPLMWKAQADAIKGQIETLRRELVEYDKLVSGEVNRIEVETLEDLPLGLIKARIAKGMTQSKLAEAAGVKAQQIQRWEEGEYYKAKFEQLVKIADALDVSISERISLEREAKGNVRTLKSLGIDINFIRRRICPAPGEGVSAVLSKSSAYLKRIWGLTISNDGQIDASGLMLEGVRCARFKLPKNADETRLKAYAQYAYTVAEIVASSQKTPVLPVSQSWSEVRKRILSPGEITLQNCLNFAWDLGIPVIPLGDSIRFHGGCWRIAGRNAIILKQSSREESRWMFDLLHEMYHASDAPGDKGFTPVDLDGTDPDRRESDEEVRANDFAGNVLLGGRAADYYIEVLEKSQRRLPQVKRSVAAVAKAHVLNVGVLANYVAFRLKQDFDADWWGAASNLQSGSVDAYSVTQAVFMKRCDMSSLGELDRRIVELATNEPEILS